MSKVTGISVWDFIVCAPISLFVALLFSPDPYFYIIYFSMVAMTSGLVALASDSTEEAEGSLSFPLIILNAFTWPVFWTVTLYRVSSED